MDYATNEQGEKTLKIVVANISQDNLTERYNLLNTECFKKFGNEAIGKSNVASMTLIVLKLEIDEKLKFLCNDAVNKYLTPTDFDLVITSIVDYPITKLNNSQLDKLFFEICNKNGLEIICKKIKDKNFEFSDNFIDWITNKILSNSSQNNYLNEAILNNESVRAYIRNLAYSNIKSDLYEKGTQIIDKFPWCFDEYETNLAKMVVKAIKDLKDAEIKCSKDRVKREIERLKEKRNNLPDYNCLRFLIMGFDCNSNGYRVYKVLYPNYEELSQFPINSSFLCTTNSYSSVPFELYWTEYGICLDQHNYCLRNGYYPKLYVERIPLNRSDYPKSYGSIPYSSEYVFKEISKDEYNRNENKRTELTKDINNLEKSLEDYEKLTSDIQEKIDEAKTELINNLLYNSAVYALNNKIIANEKEIEYFIKNFEIKMVFCPAGSFTMGSLKSEKGSSDEELHKVFLSKSFAIGKYEITQNQYRTIMGENPSYFKGDNNPVEKVSWYNAKEFCERLNKKFADKLPKGYKFDLPTEAQWEYACRAGTNTAYCNDNSENNLVEVAWYKSNSEGKTHSVGQKKPNAWGIYDMHGSVWEWCRDLYRDYPSGSVTDPIGVSDDSRYVIRGGGWDDCGGDCRAANRGNCSPTLRYNDLGFRISLVPVQ